MSRVAAIAQQLQQIAQAREQLVVQKQELEEAIEAGTIAILAITVQDTKNVPTSDLRVWIEPAEACRGQSSFDTEVKQEVVFQLVSNEGKVFFSHLEDGNAAIKLELGIDELPDGQVLMAWLKPEPVEKQESEDQPEGEENTEAGAATEIPKMEIRAEYDTVHQKLLSIEKKLQQAEYNQTALQQQLQQFQSASTPPPTVEDVDDAEEAAAGNQQVTPNAQPSQEKQRSRTERQAAAEEGKSALQTAWGYTAMAGGLMYQHSAVFIFIGSAVAMHLYGDYASV